RGHLVRHLRGLLEDFEVRDDRTALLGEARLVEAADWLAVKERGRAEDLVDGHDPRAADSHHEDVRVSRHPERRRGRLAIHREYPPRLPGGRAPGHDRQERRAVAVQAGIILIAGGLMNLRLSSEFRLDRLHRQAITLHAAVAAAFTDRLVDEDPHRGIGELAALPEPPLLRRAALVVD